MRRFSHVYQIFPNPLTFGTINTAMGNDTPQQKVLLTYQDASYKRLVLYVILFGLGYSYARFSSQGSEGGVPWYEKLVLVVIFFSFFLSIFEGLFILNAKILYKRVEFDGQNLYITARGKEAVVPLAKIMRIDMLSSGRGSRGTFSGYEVSYTGPDGERAWVYITVYWKKTPQFDQFTSLVKAQNPALQVKTVTTTLDAIIKLFKRKKTAQ